MKKRLTAILLCLSVLLMACACAAETEAPVVADPVSKEPSPQLTLSEVNAEGSKTEEPAVPSETAPAESEPEETISIEESDVVIEPIQPIVPEEKETTLEKVLSFDIGIDGLFAYSFSYPQDPSGGTPRIYVPDMHAVDENGRFFISYLRNVHTPDNGQSVSMGTRKAFSEMLAVDGKVYIPFHNSTVGVFAMDGSAVLYEPSLYGVEGREFVLSLSLSKSGEPIVCVAKGGQYFVDGKPAKDVCLPGVIKEDSKATAVVYGDVTLSTNAYIADLYGSHLVLSETFASKGLTHLYTGYTLEGQLEFNFLYSSYRDLSETVPCEIVGEKDTLYAYSPFAVSVGSYSFEAVGSDVFFGADGNAYLVVYYPDHGELYRIHPGYSDIQLPVE